MAIQSTSVLKNNALFRAGELVDGTSSYDSKALEYMNQIYRAILAGGNEFDLELGSPWSWARSVQPGTIVLQPKVNVVANLTNGSSTVTLSAGVSPSMTGQWFKVVGRSEIFRITAHTSGASSLTIDTAYTEETGTNLSSEIHIIEYDLPGSIERLIAPMVVNRQQNFEAPLDGLIYQVDLANINLNFPLKFLPEEVPQQFAVVSKDQFGSMRVRFNASVGSQTRVSFDYIPVYSELYDVVLENYAGSVPVTFQDTGDTVTLNNHRLTNGTLVAFSSIVATTGISINTSYYVVNATANTFQLSLTSGGAALPLTTNGTGALITGSVNVVTNTFTTEEPHNLINGTKIVLNPTNSDTLPSSLVIDQIYYVINAASKTFQISSTLGGSVQVFGTVGSGSVSISTIPIIPPAFSHVLEYGASTYLMIDKNDSRSEAFAGLTKAKMAAMISANDREMAQASGGRVGQMIPRLDMYSGPRRYWRQNVSP